MEEQAIENKSQESWLSPGIPIDQYYSVEFSSTRDAFLYQFKIWNIMPESMCVLVKENSKILELLKVGDILNMKYYSADPLYPPAYLDTKIRYIKKEDHGRFKGHFLIGIAILDS